MHGDDAGVDLRKLPGYESLPAPAGSVCPAAAPVREFAVSAVETAMPMLGGADGKIYVLAKDREAVLSGSSAPEPLVLSANVGDCVHITLTNETKTGPVSFHTDMLAFDPTRSMGVNAGFNSLGSNSGDSNSGEALDQTVPPGESRTFTYFAHPEVGETVALVRDWGNVLENPRLGLYGAIIVAQALEAFREAHRAPLPVRVRQHEVMHQVIEGWPWICTPGPFMFVKSD